METVGTKPVCFVGSIAASFRLDQPLDVADAGQQALAKGDLLDAGGRCTCILDVLEHPLLLLLVLLHQLSQDLQLGILLIHCHIVSVQHLLQVLHNFDFVVNVDSIEETEITLNHSFQD